VEEVTNQSTRAGRTHCPDYKRGRDVDPLELVRLWICRYRPSDHHHQRPLIWNTPNNWSLSPVVRVAKHESGSNYDTRYCKSVFDSRSADLGDTGTTEVSPHDARNPCFWRARRFLAMRTSVRIDSLCQSPPGCC